MRGLNKVLKQILKAFLPLLLCAFILYWIYRDFDFGRVRAVLCQDTHWGWMTLSLLFGVLSHVLRGWRWRLTLEPLGVKPRCSDCVDAVFLSYAASLVLPRVGEMSRCGVLARKGIPFSQSLGTVVTERLLDALCMGLITGVAFLAEMPTFFTFFRQTGTKIPSLVHLLTSPWFYVTLFSIVGAVLLVRHLLRTWALLEHVKGVVRGIWTGAMSLRKVRHAPLFVTYTLGIWVCYFLHFYLTFFCFQFTADLGLQAGLVMFVAGTFAVIVPTPNGAGPWHFAVITMMMLYGVSDSDASVFALIVHGIQTLLVIVLGLWAGIRLSSGRLKPMPLSDTDRQEF